MNAPAARARRPRRTGAPAREGDRGRGAVRRSPRAAATPPMPRSTSSCRSACSCRRNRRRGHGLGDRARTEGASAAARRRHQPVRPDHRRGAGHRLQQAPARVLSLDEQALTRRGRTRPGARPPQRQLKPHGLWYPVDVSTSAQATLGGMAGNNSCGSRSIAYGNMVHNVWGRIAWMADGSRSTSARFSAGLGRAARSPTSCAAWRGHRAEIDAHWPTVMRRVAGYNLDIFRPQRTPYTADGSVNLAHLLVGAEGTLALDQSLTLQLRRCPWQGAGRGELRALPRRWIRRSTSSSWGRPRWSWSTAR